MALTRILGRGLLYPQWYPPITTPAFSTGALIDATGEMASYCGRVIWFTDDRSGTKNISRVQFRFGAVTKSGGSNLTVSLQDVDLTTGPPMVPDGTQDQTVAIANANANFLSNTWIRTGTLSANRTVSYGDKVAVVIEFDGSGRISPDSVVLTGWSIPNSVSNGDSVFGTKTGGVWAAVTTGGPNVILEFDDGTYGTFEYATCYKTLNSTAYNSGSAADELALAFQVPVPMKVDAIWAHVLPSSNAGNFDLVLYNGTTSMASASVDANAIFSLAAKPYVLPIPEQSLSPGTQYYVSVKPTTATNITAYSFDVDDANFWTTQDGGVNFNYSSRVDAGSWAAITTTRRLFAGFRISQLDSGGSMIQSRVFTGA